MMRRPLGFWRYKAVEVSVGLILFVLSLPILFLAIGLFGRLMPESTSALAIAVPILLWVAGMTMLSWALSKKISKRWSH